VTTPMLALPSAGGTGPDARLRRATVPLAVIAASVAAFLVFAGLVGAYLGLKAASGSAAWPPKGVEFDNYTATVLVITAAMASVLIEWAAYAIRKGFRGQSLFGYGLTVLLGVAFLNALAYLISKFGFGPAATPYATVVHTMAAAAFVMVAVATVATVLVGLRALGHQLTTDNQEVARSAALLWHLATVCWIAVYYTVYVTK
jgi:heme/copper-type cytochrome/quinol oxidase subunit 3